MGYSDEMYKDKMLKIEREKLAMEKEKTKILADIRDILFMFNAMYGLEIETRAKNASYNPDDVKRVADSLDGLKKRIEERWSE